MEFWASILAPAEDEVETAPQGEIDTVAGFFVHPGEGSESASFALMRRVSAAGVPVDWFWRCHCKTQYASVVSDAHFVACHTTLVQLLDIAGTLGIARDVFDETSYWEMRDATTLISALRGMNQLIAGFAGQLHDAIGDAHTVEAAIFDHPRLSGWRWGAMSSGPRSRRSDRRGGVTRPSAFRSRRRGATGA